MTGPVVELRPRRFLRKYATYMDRRSRQMEKMRRILARMIADWIKQYIEAKGQDFKNIHLADMVGKEYQKGVNAMCEQCYDGTMSDIELALAIAINEELYRLKLHNKVKVGQSGIWWGIRPYLHIQNIQTN